MSNCNCDCCTNKYLVPNKNEKEIVILSDRNINIGVMQIGENAMVLNECSMDIVFNSFINEKSVPIGCFIQNGQQTARWVQEVVEDNIFEIQSCTPQKKLLCKYQVCEGDVINPDSQSKQIKAQYPGCVYKILVNNTVIYMYESYCEVCKECDPTEETASVWLYSDPRIIVYPRILDEDSGVNNCQSCAACKGCTSCLICALCDEVNVGAALASAAAAAGTTSAFTSASSFYNVNKDN